MLLSSLQIHNALTFENCSSLPIAGDQTKKSLVQKMVHSFFQRASSTQNIKKDNIKCKYPKSVFQSHSRSEHVQVLPLNVTVHIPL